MTGGVSDYAAVNARVRVMYSSLLSGPELGNLTEAPDLGALVAALRHTAYGSFLEDIKDKELTSRAVLLGIKRRLALAFQSLIHAAPGSARGVLRQLFRYYEVNNLKAILRGIAVGRPEGAGLPLSDRVMALQYPLGSMTVLRAQTMLDAGSVAAAIDLLRGTLYYDVLSSALKRYTSEQSLFPLETALDLGYWRRLWTETRKLSGEDQRQAARVVGALVDANNIMWAIRYRVYQDLSEEELINYTLPFGFRVRDEDIRALAAGADVVSVVTRLYPEIADASGLLQEPRRGLPGLEVQLKRHVMRQCLAAFVGNPFHIGLPLAYLVLNDLEVQDLTVLVEAKALRVPAPDYQGFVVKTFAATA